MKHVTRLIPLLAATVLVTSASPIPRPPEPPRGSLVIVGGGGRSEAMMRRFVELAGGRGARIAVVPNASSEPEETGRDLVAERGQGDLYALAVPVGEIERGLRPLRVGLRRL